MPVRSTEYLLPRAAVLVTVTDPQGRILYANTAFGEASGLTRGAWQALPYDALHHPDMPDEALRDLQATLTQGRPWAGLLKSRRPDGGFFWARARVTPLLGDGRTAARLVVQTRPAAGEVRAAELHYAAMRASDDHDSLGLERPGSPAADRATDRAGRRRLPLPPATRVAIASGILAAMLAGVGMALAAGGRGLPALALAAVASGLVLAGFVARAVQATLLRSLQTLAPLAEHLAAGQAVWPLTPERLRYSPLTEPADLTAPSPGTPAAPRPAAAPAESH